MTGLMLIGVLRGTHPAPSGAPAHARLTAGPWTGLALEVAETLDPEDTEAAVSLARLQHCVLCHYIAEVDVLPVAMGALFSNPAAIRAHLERDASHLRALADRLSGQVEYTVAFGRDAGPQTMTPPARRGADHLRQRRDKRDRARNHSRRSAALMDDVAATLTPITTALRRRGANREGRIGALDLLVRREDVVQCVSGIETHARDAEALGLSLSLTGPYPALSFVAEPEFA